MRGLQKFGLLFKLCKQKYETPLKVHEPLYQELLIALLCRLFFKVNSVNAGLTKIGSVGDIMETKVPNVLKVPQSILKKLMAFFFADFNKIIFVKDTW